MRPTRSVTDHLGVSRPPDRWSLPLTVLACMLAVALAAFLAV